MPDEKVTVSAAGQDVMNTDASEEVTWRRGLPWPLRIVEVVLRTFQIAGMAVVVVLMLLTVAHVIGRYVFGYPMLGVVEVSGLAVVTLVFFAAPYDFFIDRHIAVDVIVRRLPARAALALNCFTYLATLAAITLALIWTIKKAEQLSGSGSVTDMLRIPIYPFYIVVAFGWLLSAVAIVARLVRFSLEIPRGGESKGVSS